MKKKLVIFLVLVLVCVNVVGCQSKPATNLESNASTPQPEDSGPASTGLTVTETGWVPEKEIKCIVPFAPGGGSDILTRTIMKYIDLPVGMVAVNVEGGAGLIGAQETSNSKPDGYTILAHNPMNLISQGLTGNNNLWKDLTMISFIVDDWTVVSTNTETGWKSVDDFVEYAKVHPGEIKWGITGTGITMADSIRAMDGLDIEATIVPYEGGAATRTALLGNHIQIEVATSSDIRTYVESGDVIPLFVIAPNRCPFLPDVPTLLDLGVNVDSGAPRAYFAPPGLGEEQLEYIDNKFKKVCENQEFVKDCEKLGFVVQYVGSSEGTELMKKWYDANLPVFEEYGLK
jgi:tripartite-type tricarboxylate transporter receptor subunit TctC